MAEFLRPFEEATLLTEARKKSVAEVLPVIDYLLQALKTEIQAAERSGDVAMIGRLIIGWEFLERCYFLSGRSPAFVAAVLLHPRHKWAYFNGKWRAHWINTAKGSVQKLWVAKYKNKHVAAQNLQGEHLLHNEDAAGFER
ncbi:hypothetical protein BZA05DRAFT_442259 [Tricharina praecox]|uniref:uncharacterized protein n=1 Tax=Tricharina praecox TaxID=43433 RepID=UPI002220175F|nr:uncharacterized protein BZA05DRAFT_442259 [Tricharina praecox]KAI5856580.1 hypothetical protein BZA05DRAFT_442259 [Tricharina praecox]